MILHIRKKTIFLYIVLFTAIFNDILRIGNSSLTIYRGLMVFAILYCFFKNRKGTCKIIGVYITIIIVNLIQSIGFDVLNSVDVDFSMSRFIEYHFFYFSIFVVILIVYTIYVIDKNNFSSRMREFLLGISWCLLLVFIFIYFIGIEVAKKQYGLSNVNNYGIYLAAILPFHLIDAWDKKKVSSYIFIILALLFMILNDCLIVVVGVLIEIIILLFLKQKKNMASFIIVTLVMLILIVVFIGYMASDGMFLGRNMKRFVSEALEHIFTNTLYAQSNTSITFRINVIIVGFRWIIKTLCLGIGAGNAGLLMNRVLTDYKLYSSFTSDMEIALHNAPIELLLEFGFIALSLYIFIWKIIFRKVKKDIRSENDEILIIACISMWAWILSPSMITSTYYFYIVLAYIFVVSRHEDNNLSLEKRSYK